MGFKVTVEDAKCIQANAFIQEGIFQKYTIKEEQLTFKINLTVLLVSKLSRPIQRQLTFFSEIQNIFYVNLESSDS